MSCEIKPQGNRVVLEYKAPENTQGGIILPDSAQKKPKEGVVVAIGPGRYENGQLIPIDLKVGDEVYYSSYSGTEVQLNDKEYLIIGADDIFGVLEQV